jgi:hypothetical protein
MSTRALIADNHSLLRESCMALFNKLHPSQEVPETAGVNCCVPKTEKEPIGIIQYILFPKEQSVFTGQIFGRRPVRKILLL